MYRSTISQLSNVNFVIDPLMRLLTSDIPRVENCFPVPLNQEHDCPRTVVRIQERDSDMLFRGEFDLGWCIQWDWTL